MLTDPITLTHPSGPGVFNLTSMTGSSSVRTAVASTPAESETLNIKHSQDGKAGAKIKRSLIQFQHSLVPSDGSRHLITTNYTITTGEGAVVGEDFQLIAFEQLCRLVNLLMPTIETDEWVISDRFKQVFRGEP